MGRCRVEVARVSKECKVKEGGGSKEGLREGDREEKVVKGK